MTYDLLSSYYSLYMQYTQIRHKLYVSCPSSALPYVFLYLHHVKRCSCYNHMLLRQTYPKEGERNEKV